MLGQFFRHNLNQINEPTRAHNEFKNKVLQMFMAGPNHDFLHLGGQQAVAGALGIAQSTVSKTKNKPVSPVKANKKFKTRSDAEHIKHPQAITAIEDYWVRVSLK